jgi:ATP-dependent helicase/nuclease subunit A
MKQPSLFDEPVPGAPDRPSDWAAREYAIDPAHDVVLEASAGTGKTRVLVDRYVRLIEQGTDPANILAITFTRKAAAEMRERVLVTLRRRAAESGAMADRWRELRNRISDIQISTIDAFCFGLLREFPLEAGVEPGFDIADETEMGRFAREAADRALRIVRSRLVDDEPLRLLFARVKTPVLARTLEELIDRRHIALPAVASFVKRRPGAASAAEAADEFLRRLREVFAGKYARALIDEGPHGAPEFDWLAADLVDVRGFTSGADLTRVQQLRRRLERYFLTRDGQPRKRLATAYKADRRTKVPSSRAHAEAVAALAPEVDAALKALDSSIDALLARGVLRLLTIAVSQYDALMEEHALLDFAGMLDKAVALLEQQEEFARSRLKLQARYHHVLVDEFQDTSRQQWRLVELLLSAWGEGEGIADAPTSIFIVGDRKQSIYRFRHAEVTLLEEAGRTITALRPGRAKRQAITTSFRAVPELLAFVNALSHALVSESGLADRFTYGDTDRFPEPGVSAGARRDGEPVLGLIAEPGIPACAAAVAVEVQRLLSGAVVRDKDGPPRPVTAGDIAILFRARAGHQFFESALESRGIRTYVYKGLGFFDAPEVQDLQALLRVLAQPESDLRAAEFLRSRFVRISDVALTHLAPGFADALAGRSAVADSLNGIDRDLLACAVDGMRRWRALADVVPPSELVDLVLRESAYAFELRGRKLGQARENVKKVRALVRRVESRGYATLGRIAEYFDTLKAGEESNAILEASDCVSLMTMHAAKGLEYPIVFLVNLQAPGRGGFNSFRVIERGPDGEPEVAFSPNPATELDDERDAEELRRLLYVGVTRARDRLYFAGELDPRGQIRRAGRSLAGLLPASFSAMFGDAAADPDREHVTWVSDAQSFDFRVCRASDARPLPVMPEEALVPADAEWLVATEGGHVTAGEITARQITDEAPLTQADAAPGRELLVGSLVHRLFQRDIQPGPDGGEDVRIARAFLRGSERHDAADPNAICAEAMQVYRAFRARADVRALLASGTCLHEVPFSLHSPLPGGASVAAGDAVIRGVIDCLVIRADQRPVVVEFKTGRARPEHARQAAIYRLAVAAALGAEEVDLQIVYA